MRPRSATAGPAQRKSSREFSPRILPSRVLSTLLWAAFGIDRPDTGGRTAPSAHHWQEIAIFAVLADGAYRCDPVGHLLRLAKTGDLRGITGMQDFVGTRRSISSTSPTSRR